MNTPNKLTVFRILLVPVVMALLLTGHGVWATIVFIVASLTDFLDGYLARKNDQISNFGKIMDPLADKLLIFGVLLCFTELGVVKAWVPMIIIAREFLVTCLRVVAVSKGSVIAASMWGKVKTNVQIFAEIIAMFVFVSHPQWAECVLWIAAAVTVLSGVAYVVENKDVFRE
ncbi:MAG: CDP-diacylglycerol--glycerol-3-phosphate 3-phosphatidyltransferase [Clostridia bacterium]|nr:CDP-diacylglycerol--glycerol-3-phosphate 3-phosphatidyltransferase [Clostridia bacterium]